MMKPHTAGAPLSMDVLRERLAAGDGPRFWKSFEELAATPDFLALVEREFPSQLPRWDDQHSRRSFLRLMAASLAMTASAGCMRQPLEPIVPHVQYPEYSPSETLQFATAMTRGGYGLGVLATSRAGRPTKIEGNPLHPASLGATDAFAQASILGLYDPDRSQTVVHRGVIETWDRFLTELTASVARLRERRGAGLRVLTETVTSPTIGAQLLGLLDDLPEARWHQYEPAGLDNIREGCQTAFGRYLQPRWHIERASRIVALDANFLSDLPGSVRYAREFIDGRRIAAGRDAMNRLYAVESAPTITGAMADHRLSLRPSQLGQLAGAILSRVRGRQDAARPEGVPEIWLSALVEDLTAQRGNSLVIAGPGQPPSIQALVWLINAALGNVGQTVTLHEPAEARPENQQQSLTDLVSAMQAGEVETLVMLGGNPVYATPAEVDFAEALTKVKQRIHLAEYEDETSFLCDWHIPALHYLESWSDVRAFDGTATIVQPLIDPLYGGRSPHELIAILRGQSGPSAYQLVQDHWKEALGEDDFPRTWRQALHDGVVPDTTSADAMVELAQDAGASNTAAAVVTTSIEIEWRTDPTVGDGSYANNAWLQELPKPLTKITWDNASYISPRTAEQLGLVSGDIVVITLNDRSLEAPAWVMPGQADDCISLTLGYGRTRAGRVGTELGYSAYAIAPAGEAWFAGGATITKTGRKHRLATTQDHHSLEGRDIVRVASLAEFQADPKHFEHGHHSGELPNLYPRYESPGHAWGMAIDQTACIGCNACMIACQAENNVPVVGRDQVERGREMHWLRIDRYYEGSLDNPETYFQPMLCVHCEQAPCEVVCPVAATVHDAEGTNNMIYNRCVGTRYCSNNCPYKVRRFNYLQYTDTTTESLKLLRNPDVTVRSRGVMEKCTYCIQRISGARIAEKRDGQPLMDGQLVTACQQACPTRAIIFGDLNDPNSEVRRLKESPLNYGVLAELNTRPRTTYLARITNPHPKLTQEKQSSSQSRG
jgi:MoCo/4Fe-4S cofactor protein with predicted Tat translocation signal